MKQEARRTMSEALRTVELPAAAIAVIKEGALKPRADRTLCPSLRSACRHISLGRRRKPRQRGRHPLVSQRLVKSPDRKVFWFPRHQPRENQKHRAKWNQRR